MNLPLRHTADAVIFTAGPDPRVLLVRRAADHDTFPGAWALPGGHVDPGENSRRAAARELFEETGLPLTAHEETRLRPVGTFDQPGREPRGRYSSDAYTLVLPHLVDVAGGDDADRAEWVPLVQALSTPLAFDHDRILRAALAVAGLPVPASH